jgi:hypothetical protein
VCKGRGYVGYGLGKSVIEKWILEETGCKSVVWNCVVQDRVKSLAVVKTVMSVRIINKKGELDRRNVTDRLDTCLYVMQFVSLKFTSQG